VEVGDNYTISTITPLIQGSSKSCWATCYAMMLQYAGRGNSPSDVQTLLDTMKSDSGFYAYLKAYAAANPDVTPAVDPDGERDIWTYGNSSGLQVEQMPYSARAIGLIGQSAVTLNNEDKFLYVLQTYGPIWCAGHFIAPDGLHALLAVGIEKTRLGASIHVIDPYGTYNTSWQRTEYQLLLTDFYKALIKEPFSAQIWQNVAPVVPYDSK
jgi:Papain-like cysteine protease AvrRpt2